MTVNSSEKLLYYFSIFKHDREQEGKAAQWALCKPVNKYLYFDSIFNCKTMAYVWVGKCAVVQKQYSLHACARYTKENLFQSLCYGAISLYPVPFCYPSFLNALLVRQSVVIGWVKYSSPWLKGLLKPHLGIRREQYAVFFHTALCCYDVSSSSLSRWCSYTFTGDYIL